jgi:signal transduction histidine kinase/DNA-binding response OmpR family regulator/HPt (histidine-containing phosphotransfer) domain-containing protein
VRADARDECTLPDSEAQKTSEATRTIERDSFMHERRVVLRYAILSFVFVAVFLLLNRPEVIVISRLGAVVWYPAAGLVLALMLGVSPWYAFLVGFSGALAGILIYDQSINTFSGTIGAAGVAGFYAAAAWVLRGPLKIDLQLRRRRDVVLYVSVTTTAALVSTGVGVICLVADHSILWSEFWRSASLWFLGDEIGLLGIAPFLLIHVFPWVRRQLSARPAEAHLQKKHPQTTPGFWTLVELGGQICALLLSSWMVFGVPFLQFQVPFITFVPITWIAMRQGIQRVVSGLLALNFGIVVGLHFFPPTLGLLPEYGLLMFVVSATGLIVGSAVTERHRLAVELLERTDELLDANTQMVAAKYKAEEASRIKGEFLANMSHEIRTPVNGIVGMTELVLDTELTHEQREYLTMLKSSGDSLLGVINDILDFSKVEAGKLELDPVEFNLRDTIAETLRGVALRAHEKGLELAYHADPQIPEYVVGDSGRLRQVLVNLVGNAIKFTSEGDVIVRLQMDSCSDHELGLHFSVADTGIGIPVEKHSLVFEAFAQADGSTTRNFGGTGLGLAISSRLASLMGGRVWLEGTAAKGSTFHFTVRFGIGETHGSSEVPAQRAALIQVPVLVVDDNEVSRQILVEITKGWGMAPTAAESGSTALRAFDEAEARDAGFRLAIIDSRMPGMDGFQLAEQIMENPRRCAAIVMMVTSGQRAKVECYGETGIAACLLKPIRESELMSAVLRILGHASSDVAPEPATSHGPGKTSRQLRILIAEDNPVNQRVVVRMLEKMGHVPTIAHNGREALSMLGEGIFDLVFMDVQMPEIDGLTATRTVRKNETQTGAHIPIIAMTAHALKGDKARCLTAGMDAYISKPVTSKEIADTIAEFFPLELLVHVYSAIPLLPASSSLWDRSTALARVDGDEFLLRELVQVFLDESPRQLIKLQHAIETVDPEEIERTAHSLKGELSYLGLPTVAQKARDLERMGHERTLQPAAEVLGSFQADVSAVADAMRDMLQERHESVDL